MEGIILAQPNTLQELGTEAHEGNTAERLGYERHRRDLGPVKVAATEEMPVVGTGRHLLFELIGNDHHLNVSIQIEVDTFLRGSELADGITSLIDAALTNQPPRAKTLG